MAFDPTKVDYLRPIRDDNRDEYIMLPFHRVLKNTNLALVRNLMNRMKKDADLVNIFPNVKHFAQLNTATDIYNATVVYNHPEDLIFFLSGDRLTKETCKEFVRQFLNPLRLDLLHNTNVEYSIKSLMEHKFVKRLYIVAPKFTDEMQGYLVNFFDSKDFDTNRICLIEGNMVESVSEFPEVTTLFLSDFADFKTIYDHTPERVSGKLIAIAEGYDNMEPDPTLGTKKQPKMANKGIDLFIKLHNERKAEVSYFFPFAMAKL